MARPTVARDHPQALRALQRGFGDRNVRVVEVRPNPPTPASTVRGDHERQRRRGA